MRVSPAEYETVPECCKLSHKIKLYQKFKNYTKYFQNLFPYTYQNKTEPVLVSI